jgi:hypothetical protein
MKDRIIEEAAEAYCMSTYVRPSDEKGLKSYEKNSTAMPGYTSYSKRAKKHFIAGANWHKSMQFQDATETITTPNCFLCMLKRGLANLKSAFRKK